MNLSIKNKLVLSIGAIILVITGLQVWYNTSQLRSETQRLIWSFIDDSSVANVKGISRWLDARINLVTATKEAFARKTSPQPPGPVHECGQLRSRLRGHQGWPDDPEQADRSAGRL